MALEVTYPHIDKPAGDVARLKRTPRVRVAQIVMDYLDHGWSAETMCKEYPHLTPAEVHAALTYYYDHQEEIDREIADEIKQVEQDMAKARRSLFYLRM